MAVETKEKTTPEGQATDDAFNNIMSHPDNADLRDSLNAQEQPSTTDKDGANEDVFGYLKNRGLMSDKPPGTKKKSWFMRHRGAVAGGGSVIILIGGFFTIAAPLKLQGILESVTGVGMGRIEGYIEKRTQKIVFQALFQHLNVGDRSLVKGGSLISRIAKTMTANKFEERLAQKGIQFVKDGNAVKVRLTGANTAEAQKILSKAYKNADDLEAALESTAVTRKMMKTIIKEDLGIWGYLVRGKMTRWMMSYLGIKRFGTAKTSETATPKEKMKTAALDDIADSLDAQGRSIDQAMDVMSTTDRISSQADDVVSDTGKTASTQAFRETLSESSDAARTAITNTEGGMVTKIVLGLGEKLGPGMMKTVVTNVGKDLVPIYGWLVGGATAVVFSHWVYKNSTSTDGTTAKAFRAIASPAAILMSNIYAKWGGIATQGKLGTLDTDLYNYYIPFLDGVETSSLFNCVDKNWTSDCESTGKPAYKKLNETSSEAQRQIIGLLANNIFLEAQIGDYSPNYLLSRLVYNLDDMLMGAAMNGVVSAITGYANVAVFLAKMGAGEERWNEMTANVEQTLSGMAQFGMEIMLNVFGLNISMLSGGNQLFDILLNGSVYAGNRYAETSLGLHEINAKTASAQMQQYIAEQTEYDKSKGVLYALFSPDAQSSVTSRAISRMSFGGGAAGTASNAVASLFGLVKSTPSSLANVITNKASAVSYSSPEAVLNAVAIGMTNAELAAPLNAAVNSGEACPAGDLGDSVASWFGIDTTKNEGFDNCKLDSAVAESVLCSMDDSIRETPQCNPDAGGIATGGTAVSGTCSSDSTADYNMQDGYDNSTTATKIHTCGIKDWPSSFPNSAGEYIVEVNAEIAEDTAKMAAALKADATANGNYNYTASIGFRTFAQQQCIYDYFRTGNRGCSVFVTRPSAASRPGYSNHQMGYSIDMESGYSCRSPSFTSNIRANQWLNANMKTYGFSRDVGCSDYGHFTHAH